MCYFCQIKTSCSGQDVGGRGLFVGLKEETQTSAAALEEVDFIAPGCCSCGSIQRQKWRRNQKLFIIIYLKVKRLQTGTNPQV